MSKRKHRRGDAVSLTYTIDDDGVHLVCGCGWDYAMGFVATPIEALRLACEHTGEEPILLLTERE